MTAFDWFDDPSRLHFLSVVGVLTLLVLCCFLPRSRARWAVVFEFAIMGTVIIGRWPSFFAGRLMNPDESQIIAGAATLWHRPEFWKWVDGTTIGPLSFYSLWLGKFVGLGFGYPGARFIAAAFLGGSFIALYRFLRNYCPEQVARVSTVPFATFGCLVLFWDIVQYGNEATAIFLLCIGIVLAFPARELAGRHYLRMAAAGMALGAVPFAKLHVGPMALFVGITALFAVVRSSGSPGKPGRIGALIAGALVVPAIGAAYLSVFNLWHHFFLFYLQNNFSYAKDGSAMFEMALGLFSFLGESYGVLQLVLGTMVFCSTCLWFFRGFSKEARRWAYWSLAFVAVSLICLLLPGREFQHYQLLLIPSLFLLCGAFLAGMSSLEQPPSGRLAMIVLFLAATTVPLAAIRLYTHHSSWSFFQRGDDEIEPVVAELRFLGKPGEMMAIWGWQPELWVDTGLIQGTRDGNTFRQTNPDPQIEYYRTRFLFDLRRNVPPFFLDAVGPGRFFFKDRNSVGHETWPDLAAFVAEHYVLHRDIAGVRIYLRKDRASTRRPFAAGPSS